MIECARNDEPCSSVDCGRCLPICNVCGDDHLTDDHVAECAYCSRPAVIESAIGLEGDYDDERRYIAPRPESRCEECHEEFERTARRTERLAQEGWI